MDINSLLPLLLSGSGNADKAKLFAMLTGGKSAEEAVTEAAGPEMSGLMNMLMQSRQKPRTPTFRPLRSLPTKSICC